MSNISFTDLTAHQKVIGDKITDAVNIVIKNGRYIMGPQVAQFENDLREFSGAKHAISCANGTDALLLILMAYGIKPGDVIFVPSFTFAATAEVVAMLGAVPFFVDVDSATYNISCRSLEDAIGRAKELNLPVRGVIAVDLFGRPAPYRELQNICDEENLILIADAAQSFGSVYEGRPVGTLAKTTAVSFFPAKPLGCYGDGGAVLTMDDGLAAAMRSIRVHGQGAHKYDNIRLGMNSRLDTIQAAVLIEKLKIFESELAQRQNVAAYYDAHLSGACVKPGISGGFRSSWAQYTVVLDGIDRDALMKKLSEKSIPTMIYYLKPLHLQPAYDHCPRAAARLENSEYLSSHVVSLPMHPYLLEEHLHAICQTVNQVCADLVRAAVGGGGCR
ncbi:MAG: DegT/DnrJ/EryC1/StrS aminotransferase family protein [Elusimicrobia bacterium]|nr:DegT/DnrJ/EryC1/StrS aminotransferase family protein [Elusimicrobiota bacterium]